MARAKKKPAYEVPPVTETMRAEALEKMHADIERARREGVYEEAKKWRGKIKWSVSLEELRDED